MSNTTTALKPNASFLLWFQERTGDPVSRCYQCRKCANGCPLSFAMDWPPNQIMRLIQLGAKEELLQCRTIWVCAACQTCTTRCPNEIDIAHVMDGLRQLCLAEGAKPAEPAVVKFHQAFLKSVARFGRAYEVGTAARYKLTTGQLFQDAKLAWEMFRRGKLRLLPEAIKDRKQVWEMFRQLKEKGGQRRSSQT